MECLEKPIWNRYTREELFKLTVESLNKEIYNQVLKKWDSIAKPIDGMGRFEKLTAQIGAIQGNDRIDIDKKAVVIMCADNGIVAE